MRDRFSAKTCDRCGTTYVGKIASARYCGDSCRIQAGNERQAARNSTLKAAEPERQCAWCQKSFKRNYGDMRQRYCSETCETARQNRARSGNTHRRRAKRFGVSYEHVNKLKVFARDRWRCQLCGDKVKVGEAELDHIVPLSKGGPHSYVNTQCSCKPCNAAKGDKVLGQQLLFG
jgi:5-methylcytosine-specific restriction endonuclease McrA